MGFLQQRKNVEQQYFVRAKRLGWAHAIVWQENFFDHRLRTDETLGGKADYILQNPVRAGLAKNIEDWPYVWKAMG